MSEEKNNVEIIPEFKMYITDLETGKDSKEINVSDLIFDDYIEFEFGDYEEDDYATLPYKDFKFFINDYSITIYSPQMKELENQLQQKEKEIQDLKQKNDYLSDLEASAVEYKELKDQLQQKENIIKEVREYILTHKLYCFEYDEEELFEITTDKKAKEELLGILDKGD